MKTAEELTEEFCGLVSHHSVEDAFRELLPQIQREAERKGAEEAKKYIAYYLEGCIEMNKPIDPNYVLKMEIPGDKS